MKIIQAALNPRYVKLKILLLAALLAVIAEEAFSYSVSTELKLKLSIASNSEDPKERIPLLPTSIGIYQRGNEAFYKDTAFGERDLDRHFDLIKEFYLDSSAVGLGLDRPKQIQMRYGTNESILQFSGIPSFWKSQDLYSIPLHFENSEIEIRLPSIQLSSQAVPENAEIYVQVFRKYRYPEGYARFVRKSYQKKRKEFLKDHTRPSPFLSPEEVEKMRARKDWLPRDENNYFYGYFQYTRLIFSGLQTKEGSFHETELLENSEKIDPKRRALLYSLNKDNHRLPLLSGDYLIERIVEIPGQSPQKSEIFISLQEGEFRALDACEWKEIPE